MNEGTILIIEDNPDILRANAAELRMAHYRVLEADTLEAGRGLMRQEAPDLILLDIILPDGSGLDYCREVFGQNAPRILFLSALHTPADVVAGLRAGGDDYMTKPYLMQELLARVEAILRRPKMGRSEQQPLSMGALALNDTAKRAYLDGTDLLLTHMEYAILAYLTKNTDRHVPAEELYQKLWDMEAVTDIRTVWEHISRLRRKLGADPAVKIESVRGRGYRLLIERADLAKS